MLKSLLEDFNSNKAFLNFLLHRNSQKASTGAAVKDKFSALQTELDRVLELVIMESKKGRKVGGARDISEIILSNVALLER